jgi:transposase-like protein
MITMILYAKIRRMYFRDQLTINEIARRTSLSRNTVKKWLRQPNGSEPVYRRRSMPRAIALCCPRQ